MRHTQRESLIGFVTLWPVARADFPASCRGCCVTNDLLFQKSLGVLRIDSVCRRLWRRKASTRRNLHLQVIFVYLFHSFNGFKQHNKQAWGISRSCLSDEHHQFAGNRASRTRHFPTRRDFDKSAPGNRKLRLHLHSDGRLPLVCQHVIWLFRQPASPGVQGLLDTET